VYVYRNGMRYLAEDKAKDGFHFHNDISSKIGSNIPRTIKIHLDKRLGAGVQIPLRVKLKKISSVKLNNAILTARIDYIIRDDAISFTFNLVTNDKIEIEGLT